MPELHEAAKQDNCNRLAYLLLHGDDVDKRDSDGRTALHISSRRGNSRCTEQLLAAGANPDAADGNGYTPLHLATLIDSQESAVQINALIMAGADLEPRLQGDRVYEQVRDWTPLMLAAYEGHAEAVRELIKAGADVNAVDWSGMNALMLAACQTLETTNKIQLLLEAGADKQARSLDGKTALDYAREHIRLISERRNDPDAHQVLAEIDEKVAKRLKNVGIDSEGLEFPNIGVGIDSVIDKWTNVIELLELA